MPLFPEIASSPDAERIRPYLPPPDFSALGGLLRLISRFISGFLLLVLLTGLFAPDRHPPGVFAAWAGLFFVLGDARIHLDPKRLSVALSVSLVALVSLLILLSNAGIRDSAMLAYPGIIILASLTVSSAQFISIVALIGLSTMGLGLLELGHVRDTIFPEPPSPRYLLDLVLMLLGTALAVRLLSVYLLKHLQKLHWESLIDSLTGLPNRRAVDAVADGFLAQGRKRGATCAALALRIDRLDHLNHNFGHLLGDTALGELGRELAATIGPDTFLARQGGDTLVALHRAAEGTEDIRGLAERLLAIVRRERDINGIVVRLDGNCALRRDPGPPASAQTLLADALIALDVAASQGRSTILAYDDSFGARVRRDYLIESALRSAIDHGKVTMHYQPVLSHPQGEVIACEALLRLEGPNGEPIAAQEAVELAEVSGLIHRLGNVILDAVLDDLAHLWEAAAGPPPIALNCSGLQMEKPEFALRVIDSLHARHLEGSSLILEITETAAISGNDQLTAALRAVAGAGVRIALDDFGAGHSSLHRLKELHADIIKFDRSLVADIGHNPDSLLFLRRAIDLVSISQPMILLEGIDSPEQITALAGLAAQAVQGYWYAPPMPLDELERYLAARRERLPQPLSA